MSVDYDLNGVEVVNLTPHAVNLCDEDGNIFATYPASGTVARCEKSQVQVGTLNGTPIFSVKMGEVYDLPEPRDNTVFIVSRITADAVPERTDVFCTNGLVRDDDGQPVGCTSFSKV